MTETRKYITKFRPKMHWLCWTKRSQDKGDEHYQPSLPSKVKDSRLKYSSQNDILIYSHQKYHGKQIAFFYYLFIRLCYEYAEQYVSHIVRVGAVQLLTVAQSREASAVLTKARVSCCRRLRRCCSC